MGVKAQVVPIDFRERRFKKKESFPQIGADAA